MLLCDAGMSLLRVELAMSQFGRIRRPFLLGRLQPGSRDWIFGGGMHGRRLLARMLVDVVGPGASLCKLHGPVKVNLVGMFDVRSISMGMGCVRGRRVSIGPASDVGLLVGLLRGSSVWFDWRLSDSWRGRRGGGGVWGGIGGLLPPELFLPVSPLALASQATLALRGALTEVGGVDGGGGPLHGGAKEGCGRP